MTRRRRSSRTPASSLAFLGIFGMALLGMRLRKMLPDRPLYRGFEGYVRLGMGMIATLDQLDDVRMVGSVLRLR